MPMTFDGSGTITGLAAGGLPNSSVITADIADAAITAAKLDGAQSGSAPIYGARAWVNFNGTGTVAIRASGNVSSITDNGVGYYRVNFTTAMPDVNYAIVNNASDDATAATITCTSGTWGGTNQTTTSALIFVGVAGAGNDRTYVGVSIFR
jgi:hypothetical protein